MIKRLFSLATLVLLAAACTDNIDSTFDGLRRLAQTGQDGNVFYATIEDSADSTATKVFADDQLRVLWNADDRITIFEKYTLGEEYRFEGKDGDNAGSFSPVSQGNGYVVGNSLSYSYAVYPHDGNTTISNDGVLSLTLPANQTYKANSFGVGANTMVSVTNDKKMLFRNVGCFLSLKLYGDGVSVKSITLKGNNGEKLAGPATVTMPVNGTPSHVMQNDATESITLTCETPVALGADADHYTEFWFVVPPTTFTKGFTVTVTDSNDGTFVKSTDNPLEVKRNQLYRMEPLEVISSFIDLSLDPSGPHFSEAVELICLVFRLMGAPEYNTCRVPLVYESADTYFASMKDHAAITLARECRQTGVAYDAVTAFGIHLVISDQGVISFNPNYVEGSDTSFDRWTSQQKNDMLEALNDFYKESHFHAWFMSMAPYRQEALASFNSASAIDHDWYNSFFGPIDNLSTQVILSFFIGNNNNGLSTNLVSGGKLLSPVMGCLYQNNTGKILFTDDGSILVHEFCHPYCNPLIAKYWDSIKDKSNAVFQTVQTQMSNQAYGNAQTMMKETFVRASTIRYFMSHASNQSTESRIQSEENRGFLMVRTLVDALDEREQEISTYPTMDDFMPKIVQAINDYVPEYSGSGQYDEYTYSSTEKLLPGVFSVSETKQVQFTKGNLYWNGSEWKFEDNQMNFPNTWDTDHVGHFYWATTASVARATNYNPTSLSTTDHLFCDGSDDAHSLTVEGISGLRVLGDGENGEIDYLLKKRTNARNLYKYPVSIKAVGKCLVIAPDDFTGTIADSYDATSWASAEAAGLVCFTPAGIRHGSSFSSAGGFKGMYYTETPKPDSENHAYMFSFEGNSFYRYPSYTSRNNGCSIRLVKEVEEDISYDETIITFEDENFKAYCVENFDGCIDGNKDGEISMAEASLVKKIEVNPEVVASLKGIEFFINLRELRCGMDCNTYNCSLNRGVESYLRKVGDEYIEIHSKLTALDVSQNTKLTYLDCSDNALTSIDVSQNTKLTYLNCKANSLENLDVSHNTELKELDCGYNRLTSLDVSKNTELTYLACMWDPLSVLDVSHNTALTHLYCSVNYLKSIDVGYNTALKHLSCGLNQLTSLDVSKNTALQYLNCERTQLTSLDVSNNGSLTRLYCTSNPSLTEIWLKTGQTIATLNYDTEVATIKFK